MKHACVAAFALVLGLAAPALAQTQPPTEAAPSAPAGRVTRVGLREVLVTLAPGAAPRVGDRMEVFRVREVEQALGGRIRREERVAVGRVTAVGQGRALIELGTNERARAGMLARATTAPLTQDRVAPPRASGGWELAATVRPFLGLGTLAGGALNDARVTRRFEAPVALHLAMDPAAFAVGRDGNAFVHSTRLVATYDSRLFEIGLGLGAATHGATNRYDGATGNVQRVAGGTAFAASQMVRLGARDGLHLEVVNAFVLAGDRFEWGSVNTTIQVPLTHESALVLRGGGGAVGYGFGEVGLRVRARGNGGPGSLFLTPTVGGALVVSPTPTQRCVGAPPSCYDDEAAYAGPMAGLGVEYRM